MGMRIVPYLLLLFLIYTKTNCRPNGVRFVGVPGTTEFVSRYKPKMGDIVSFKHYGFMQGSMRPKNPTLYRIRTDITWESVVTHWKEKKPRRPTGT